jgi:PAS domain S-box-containing protein
MKTNRPIFSLLHTLLYTMIALLIAVVVYSYYISERKSIRLSKESSMKTILDFKKSQLSEWYEDELHDVGFIAGDIVFRKLIQDFIASKNPDDRNQLLGHLKQVQEEHLYSDILVLDSNGNPLVSANKLVITLDSEETPLFERALKSGKIVETDLFYSKLYHQVFYDFLISVKDLSGRVLGGIVFRKDPETFLHPLLRYWPSPEKSAISFLAKQLPDSSAMTYTLGQFGADSSCWRPAQINLTAGQIAPSEQLTAFEVQNAEGYPYFIASSTITGTHWEMVLQVDKYDIFRELRLKLLTSSIIGFLILLIAIFMVGRYDRLRHTKEVEALLEKEIELRRYQEQFKVIMDVLGDGILTVAPNGKIMYMNQKAEQLTGWKFKEEASLSWTEVLQLYDWNGVLQSKDASLFQRASLQGSLYQKMMLESKIGNKVPVDVLYTSFQSPEMDRKFIIVSLHDETENRRQEEKLQKSESRFRNLFLNAPDGFLLAVRDRTIRMVNGHTCSIFGYNPQELKNMTVVDLLPERFRSQMNFWEDFFENPRTVTLGVNLKLYGLRKDGTEVPIEISLTPLSGINEEQQAVCIIRDLTERRRNEQSFRMSGAIIGKMEEGVSLFTQDSGVLLFVNPKMEAMLGYESGELTNENISCLYKMLGKTSEESAEIMLQMLRENKKMEGEMRCSRKDGSKLWCSVNVFLYMEDELGPVWMAIHQDISLRKKAEEELALSEASYKYLFENNPLPMWVYEIETLKILAVNSAAINKYGYSAEEFLGMETVQLIPEEDREAFLQNLVPGPVFQLEKTCRHRLKNGSIIFVERASHDLIYYFKKARLVLSNDVTKTRQYEADLIAAKETAEQSERLKSAFLANMSHEIRTPLNGIIGFSGIIAETDVTDKDAKQFAQYIKDGGLRLLNLIDNILHISKIESGVEELSTMEFNVKDFMKSVFNQFLIVAKTKNLAYRMVFPEGEESMRILTDNIKLGQILTNFLNNAFKFTSVGFIELGVIPMIDFVEFYVKDTGKGILPEMKDAIFERFFQVDNSVSRGFEGAGLGLAICKGFAGLIEGNIRVDTEYQKGSTFYLRIPMRLKESGNNR